MSELQVFNLSRYAMSSRNFYRDTCDIYNKETMLHIPTHLMPHPTTNTFLISKFVYDIIQILRQYCEDYLHTNIL